MEQQTKNVSLARKGRYYDVDIWLKLLAIHRIIVDPMTTISLDNLTLFVNGYCRHPLKINKFCILNLFFNVMKVLSLLGCSTL